MGELVLVLGGRRSGKSRLAERLAGETAGDGRVAYVATATRDPSDAEMAARIDRHRRERPGGWTTHEVPRDLAGALATIDADSVLVDCATLWLTNLALGLGGGPPLGDEAILDAVGRALEAARGRTGRVVWVSNEVGSGLVPENALARRFGDVQGLANQRLAAGSDSVHLCVAGLTIRLK
jgi:adenosylcobinamide kinase/adenosylcobinamide-phosphate guanylyltransferase